MLKRVSFGIVVSLMLVLVGIPDASHASTFIDNTDYHASVAANDLHIVYKSNAPMTIEENLLEKLSEDPEGDPEPLGWGFNKTKPPGGDGSTWECTWNKGEEGEDVNVDDWVHAGVLAEGYGSRFWIETAYWTFNGAVVEIITMNPPETGLTVGSGADEYVAKVHNPDTDTVSVPPITIYASEIPLGLDEVKPGSPPGEYPVVWPGFDLVPGGVETLLWHVGYEPPFFAFFQGELMEDGEVICRYARMIEYTGTIPTLTEWGMIIMFVVMAAGIIWFVVRQRRRVVPA